MARCIDAMARNAVVADKQIAISNHTDHPSHILVRATTMTTITMTAKTTMTMSPVVSSVVGFK
jgi:hypothetical protein